ncbi:uncharacterized protein DNG_09783 [Cephalotrichum gorgonifer]|uniref:Uncharacterized protein n=1 Tax=Cephalotrichum gorgonifer TaxID=2041049 RepID=A0AAE8N7F9_9PEZI|nr:uncharacterized protein DNG_09783 [Cephalotrichum gorgonifer]
MASLPLKVKLALRDSWEPATSPLQQALSALRLVLGYEIVLNPEWPLLLAALDSHYVDKHDLVTAVAGCVLAWSTAFKELLEDEGVEAWTDEVLELLKNGGGKLRVNLEVSKTENTTASWNAELAAFSIALPNLQVTRPLELIPTFKSQLLSLFNDKSAPEGWDDVKIDAIPAAPTKSTSEVRTVEYMPDVNTLPRPDDLLLKPPYHALVWLRGGRDVEVQANHSPTLQLIADYLRKWCRTNHQVTTKSPMVKVTLYPSAFGLGALHDRLVFGPDDRYRGDNTVSPTIVLSLLEGVLGYEQVYCDSTSWSYRRDRPFKKL